MFKGVDPHGGTAPASVIDYIAELEATIDDGVPVALRAVRQGCVFYAQKIATTCEGGIAVTEPVAFSNRLPGHAPEMSLRTYAEHGRPFMGNQVECIDRLGLEIAMCTYNLAVAAGFESFNIDNLLSLLQYQAIKQPDWTLHCHPLTCYNPHTNTGRREIQHRLEYLACLEMLNDQVYINFTKSGMSKSVNDAEAKVAGGKATPALVSEPNHTLRNPLHKGGLSSTRAPTLPESSDKNEESGKEEDSIPQDAQPAKHYRTNNLVDNTPTVQISPSHIHDSGAHYHIDAQTDVHSDSVA
ncbi:unnamed protein product [Peniophora sp. CBMAI 1063]|nr:unnamed protein product [Peniophora sp. CBMAI 1063]